MAESAPAPPPPKRKSPRKRRPPRADGQPARHKWTEETRNEALALYARTDSTLAVQRYLGVPPPTLREWLSNEEHAALVATLRSRALSVLSERFVSSVALGIEESRIDLEQGGLGPGKAAQITRDLSTAYRNMAPEKVEEPDDSDLPGPFAGV